jgi:hypothetical protein
MDNLIWIALGAVVPLIISWIVSKYNVEKKLNEFWTKYPELKGLALRGDKFIDLKLDELKKKYPEEKWDDLIEKAYDKLIEEIGLSEKNPLSKEEAKKFLGIF